MGRTCEDIIKMFKYLFLKTYFKLSDRGLVERTKTDLLFKYFLGYDPEETKLISSSLLTVFRRERLKDEEINLMDKLIQKTVEIALEKGLIEVKNKIIVDSTHTNAIYHHISPREELISLIEKSKNVGIEVEAVIGDGAYSEEDNLNYCNENNVKNVSKLSSMVTHGNSQRNNDFEYNKDAGRYVCKAGSSKRK